MKRVVQFLLMFLAFGQIVNATGWTQIADLNADPRTVAVAFSIGAFGYVGTGLDTSAYPNYHPQNDWWQYDTTSNSWTQMADFGGPGRYAAVGFSIGNKGYVGTGYDFVNLYNDFWEFDPIANTWTIKDSFPGGGRYFATGFGMGAKGYIGTGINDTANLADFYEYDQATDTWTQKADFGGGARGQAFGFSLNGMGYIGLGGNNDFWQWNPNTNIWTQKADFPAGASVQTASFTIGGYGYVGTGYNFNAAYDIDSFYRYDPTTDTWFSEPDFIGNLRDGAVGFSIGPNGYVGSGTLNDNNEFSYTDFFKFTPSCTNAQLISAAASATSICGNVSTNLTATGNLNSALNWYWYTGSCGGTLVNEGTTISVSPTITTTYYVLGQGGCVTPTSCDTVIINVIAPPTASITSVGPTSFCIGGSATLDAGIYITYLWNNSSTNETITTDTSGNYVVTITDGTGCTGTASQVVTVNALPTPSITGGNIVCSNASLTLDAGTYSSYLWSTNATTETISVTTANSYMVTVTDNNGCTGTANQIVQLNTITNPVISGGNAFCAGDSVTIITGIYSSYNWSNGRTTQSITVLNGNTYTVTVTNGQGCTATASQAITENPNPVPVITSSGPFTDFCYQDSVYFSVGTYSQYIWNNNATTETIMVGNVGGGHHYIVTVTDANGCTGTTSQLVTVYPNPTPSFISPRIFCQGDSTGLISDVGLPGYSWSTGATTEAITVYTSNTYTLTETDGHGCTGSASVVVIENPNPIPVITGGAAICSGDTLTLTVLHYSAYHWNNSATTQSILVGTTGVFAITVTDSNGCKGSATDTVHVGTAPGVVITGGSIFCSGNSLTLNAGNFLTYLWNTGATTPSININTQNVYSVTVTNASGCSGTATDTVTMSVNPVPVISGGNLFCNGNSLTISVPFFTLYHWSTGSNNESITITTPNTYSITVTNINGCTGTASTTVNTLPSPSPVITASGPTTFCEGDSVILNAGAFSSYLWNTNHTTQSITAYAYGTYFVTVTNSSGCTASASKMVTVIDNPIPTISPIGNIKLCEGENVMLLSSNGIAYAWSNGNSNQGITVDQTGTYSVTVYYGANCSATSNATVVNVYPIPVATITSNPSNPVLCPGDSITLTTSGLQPLTYLWNAGNATTQSIKTDTAGTFIVMVTDTNHCHSTSSITVNAYGNPAASFTYSNMINTTTFTNTSANATEYFWYFGDGDVSTMMNPSHTYAQTGTYTVKLIATNPCGSDTITHTFVLTGINEINAIATGFNLYPNPANEQLTIVFNSAREAAYSIQLEDITGRKILDDGIKANFGENQFQIDLSQVAKGIYLVILQNDEGVIQSKLIIQ